MDSRFKLGARAYFQPNLRLIDARTGCTNAETAAPCEVTGIGFTEGKVFYDIDVIYVEGAEYRVPLRRIPSDMLADGEVAHG